MDFIKISIHRLTKDRFALCVFLVIIFAAVLRFYNFGGRWGLAYDQARDVLVARHALSSYKIPLIGPFASAGQFVYGPWWFWILMEMVSIYPSSVIAPWVTQASLYVAVVWLMIIIGKDMQNKQFGIILGILTAISTAQIAQSVNLTSPSMVGIFSVVSLYFFVRYMRTGLIKNAFCMAFMIAISINIHFQAIGLLILVPISFILDTSKNFKKFLYLILGIFIPFIPLIFFDITNKFFESKNWIEYLRYGQYAIYIPNRWLTYAGIYWPDSWAKIIGGTAIIGYIIPLLFVICAAVVVIRRRLTRTMIAIILSFLSIFLMLRYYRGERIDSYITFLHPFILIFTGWVIVQMLKLNRFIGLALFFIIFTFTLNADLAQIKSGENFTSIQAEEWRDALINKFPNKKFSVYDYQYGNVNKSLPLVLFLENKNKVDDKGLKVGFFIATSKTDFNYPSIWGNRGGYQILNLEATSSAYLSKEGWAHVNTSQIYKSTVEWYKKDKL